MNNTNDRAHFYILAILTLYYVMVQMNISSVKSKVTELNNFIVEQCEEVEDEF